MTSHASLARSWILEAVSNMPPIELRSFSDEHRKKLRAAKIGNAHARGAVRTPETRAKLSAAKMGNTNALGAVRSEATRVKLSAARRRECRVEASSGGFDNICGPGLRR
ncbi:hypothetical protein RSO01_82060 [Reyranella soli]|uniref:Nuclease associated modular domain-containing protein n=1 Tax=Reyranella soli TaxID=1230389 RepID=A0A512NQ15_9HYPH|nr:hypothetical protein RSO01_82060 [Reyranella soli]